MPVQKPLKNRIKTLKQQYDALKKGKDSLLALIDEAEIPENVYNSNAIENSTLTLKETEKILLNQELDREASIREVLEAKNLARVVSYKRDNVKNKTLDKELILLFHQMLIDGIDDSIAGRLRQAGEYVRVGTYIAPAPEHVERMLEETILTYNGDMETYFLDKISKFHLDFETIHPFCDGNGRIGRVVINFQLISLGFPRIIIRNKEKETYYKAFNDYREKKNTKPMDKIMGLALTESLHNRVAYLEGGKIIPLSDYIKKYNLSAPAITNAARRQTIPAFREKGVWKISETYES